jgi:outer membrane lipoprotein-sorting protein
MNAQFVCALRRAVMLCAIVAMAPTFRAEGAQASSKLSPAEIIAASAEKGRALRAALRDYTYFAEVTIQTVSQADTITGKFYRFSEISLDKDGTRQERVIENRSTLPDDLHIGSSSANNLIQVYQFVITPETMKDYEFSYVGREPVDELNTYVFDVQPRVKLPDPDKSNARYLRGRVWIDEQDMCVVKVEGRVLPEQSGHQASKFETYYQNVDSFWFPAYATANDRIRTGGYWTRVVVKVRFTNYRRATKKQ